jgi:HEAT repeat protein
VEAFGLRARAAARALGKTSLTEKAEAALIHLLKKESWMVVEAALAALSTKESLLLDVEPILAIVADRKRSVRERIYGFIALENTGTVPVERVVELLPELHPILQLLGARCLITAGDSSGIARMIDLLATETSETVDGDERDCVRTGAASVLIEVAGEDLGDSEAWREWFVALGELPPCQLETPAPTLW